MMFKVFFLALAVFCLAANAVSSLRESRKLDVLTVTTSSLTTTSGALNVALTSATTATLTFPVTGIVMTAKSYVVGLLGTTAATISYTAGLGVGVAASAVSSLLATTAYVIDVSEAIAAGATAIAFTVTGYAVSEAISVYSSATSTVGGTLLYSTTLVSGVVGSVVSGLLGTATTTYTFTTSTLALGSNRYITIQGNGNVLNIANIYLFGNITVKV